MKETLPGDAGLGPLVPGARVAMADGGGGRRMLRLLRDEVLAILGPASRSLHDAAVLERPGGRVAFTTDSYVISPLEFPGGDIGRLAVFGTINDLAMAGARPVALSLGMILEEGLERAVLRRVLVSIRRAADEVGVGIVTGDTKVVDRGKGDGMYLNTAGIGIVPDGVAIHPAQVRPGDVILVSGDLGRHGVAILSVRQGLAFAEPVASDCAALAPLVSDLLDAGVRPRCLRDLTRGGLTAALHEIAGDAGVDMEVDEAAMPVGEAVRGACEILGLEPLSVACEGRMVLFVDPGEAAGALEVLRRHPTGRGAAEVGRVGAAGRGRVHLRLAFGGARELDLPTGEQLPRIC